MKKSKPKKSGPKIVPIPNETALFLAAEMEACAGYLRNRNRTAMKIILAHLTPKMRKHYLGVWGSQIIENAMQN